MQPFQKAHLIQEQVDQVIAQLAGQGMPPDDVAQLARELQDQETYLNDCYQVALYRVNTAWGPMAHLSVKRIDKEPIRDWRDMQEIKNLLVGPEFEGVELYPAESRLVDMANQFHLWVLLEEKRFPFGFFPTKPMTDKDMPVQISGAKQRPR